MLAAKMSGRANYLKVSLVQNARTPGSGVARDAKVNQRNTNALSVVMKDAKSKP